MKTWSAKITPEQMAVCLCDDLLKKFRQLEKFPENRVKNIAEGLIDGLKNVSFPHPLGSQIPNYLKSMEPDYVAGHGVGTTWRRIAMEWPEKPATEEQPQAPEAP